MASVKKFGTFGGVFTPSILTILGVIMYLRLPWIVGQAGIYTTIGIILVAHLVHVGSLCRVVSLAILIAHLIAAFVSHLCGCTYDFARVLYQPYRPGTSRRKGNLWASV